MCNWNKTANLSDLIGKVILKIVGLEKGSEEVSIFTKDGNEYKFLHFQDCCESVDLNDFDGDADSLVDATILSAEEVDSQDEGEPPSGYSESWKWTFYKIETDKGGFWMRWLGESNGYYSESVDFIWSNKPAE